MARVPRKVRSRRKNPEGRMSVLDHLRELRRRVLLCLLFIALGAVIGWIFYNEILEFLKNPYCKVPYQHRLGGHAGDRSNCKLYFNAPLAGFTSRLQISVIAGVVLTSPFWLYQIWAFITPGLRRNERRYTLAFIALSTLLFAAGVALAYLVLSKGLRFAIVSAGSGTAANLTINSYISFVVLVLIVFGAAFELPLLVVMANLAGALPARALKRSQRVAIFLIFLFAAVATPSTDPYTMCAMAIPMVVLFECAVLFAIVHDRRKAARRAARERKAELAALADDEPSAVNPIPPPLPAPQSSADEARDQAWSDTT